MGLSLAMPAELMFDDRPGPVGGRLQQRIGDGLVSTSYDINGVNGSGGSQDSYAPQTTQPSGADIQMFEQEIEALLQRMEGKSNGSSGGDQQQNSVQALEQAAEALVQALDAQTGSSGRSETSPATASANPSTSQSFSSSQAAPLQSLATQPAGAGPTSVPAAGSASGTGAITNGTAAAAPTGTSTTSAGSGSNAIQITNTTDKPMTLGKFQNGQSTTDPSAQITLQPGQTGTISYANGEAGFVAKADASGTFQPNASRLEYEADADGKQKYPDVSYIDGRNASISLTDGAGLNKGDDKSIAGNAPAGTITTDAAGDKTIAGYYDGSTATMQAGADYMQSQIGTNGAYLHPADDQLAAGSNPMSSTQSNTIYASFGNA